MILKHVSKRNRTAGMAVLLLLLSAAVLLIFWDGFSYPDSCYDSGYEQAVFNPVCKCIGWARVRNIKTNSTIAGWGEIIKNSCVGLIHVPAERIDELSKMVVVIASHPPGAQIWINGKLHDDLTPSRLKMRPATIVIKKVGYHDSEAIVVDSKPTEAIHVELIKLPFFKYPHAR